MNPRNVRNPRTNDKSLAAAEFLTVNGLLDHHAVKRHHKSSRRQPVNRRGGDNAQLFHAGQRHLQRPRDRRRRQGQHMNIGFQIFEFFFMRNPKMLFFVNNQQPQIAEFDIVGQQCVGADDNVHRTVFQTFFDFTGLGRRL